MRVVEATAELVEEMGKPRIAMRLHDGDHPPLADLAGSLQHRGDLHRMVTVVVENVDAVERTRAREAPLDAGEAFQPPSDLLFLDAELTRHGQRRRRVESIVVARHGEA